MRGKRQESKSSIYKILRQKDEEEEENGLP